MKKEPVKKPERIRNHLFSVMSNGVCHHVKASVLELSKSGELIFKRKGELLAVFRDWSSWKREAEWIENA